MKTKTDWSARWNDEGVFVEIRDRATNKLIRTFNLISSIPGELTMNEKDKAEWLSIAIADKPKFVGQIVKAFCKNMKLVPIDMAKIESN